MVICKLDFGGKCKRRGFEADEKLLGARDTAESDYRSADLRNFHAASQAPDRTGPTPGAEFGFECGIVCRDGEGVCPLRRLQSFAKISGWEEMIAPIFSVDQKDVDVAVELAVLKAVVENVNPRRTRGALSVAR